MDKARHRFFKNPSGQPAADEQALLDNMSKQLMEKQEKSHAELEGKLAEKESLKNQDGHQLSLADIDYEIVRLKLDISQTEKRIEIIEKMKNNVQISETDWKLVKNYENNNPKFEIFDYKYVQSKTEVKSDDRNEAPKPTSPL